MAFENILKLRSGTSTEHAGFTGAAGEITFDTDKNTIIVHDGTTAGGFPLSRADQAASDIQDLNNRVAALEALN